MLKQNSLGGIYDDNPQALVRAKEVDLLTLPKKVTGTNCFNCQFINHIQYGKGMCSHPKVKQMVNGRMCCALWSNKESWKPYMGESKIFKS